MYTNINMVIDYTKAFVWITTNWKILQQMGVPDYLTYLLRNLYEDQEATVRNLRGMDWFKIRKKSTSLYIVTLFNFYAEYII